LCYYLVKGLIYLILWQATKKVEEKARENKQRAKPKKFKREEMDGTLMMRMRIIKSKGYYRSAMGG
jgi:hypothetical protein